MPKYSYIVIGLTTVQGEDAASAAIGHQEALNKWGRTGWELVSVDAGKGYLRKEVLVNEPADNIYEEVEDG